MNQFTLFLEDFRKKITAEIMPRIRASIRLSPAQCSAPARAAHNHHVLQMHRGARRATSGQRHCSFIYTLTATQLSPMQFQTESIMKWSAWRMKSRFRRSFVPRRRVIAQSSRVPEVEAFTTGSHIHQQIMIGVSALSRRSLSAHLPNHVSTLSHSHMNSMAVSLRCQ